MLFWGRKKRRFLCPHLCEQHHSFIIVRSFYLTLLEDFLGRRRRLPEINLEPYTVELKNNKDDMTFNPILGCNDHEYIDPLVIKWQNEIKTCSGLFILRP